MSTSDAIPLIVSWDSAHNSWSCLTDALAVRIVVQGEVGRELEEDAKLAVRKRVEG